MQRISRNTLQRNFFQHHIYAHDPIHAPSNLISTTKFPSNFPTPRIPTSRIPISRNELGRTPNPSKTMERSDNFGTTREFPINLIDSIYTNLLRFLLKQTWQGADNLIRLSLYLRITTTSSSPTCSISSWLCCCLLSIRRRRHLGCTANVATRIRDG